MDSQRVDELGVGQAKAGDAHVLVGLASGLEPGVALIVRAGEETEDRGVVHETWLRKDGLVVLLREPLLHSHPAGARVTLLRAATP